MKSLPQIATNAKQHPWPKPKQPDAPENPSDLAEVLPELATLTAERTMQEKWPKLRIWTEPNAAERASEGWPKQKMPNEVAERQDATNANH